MSYVISSAEVQAACSFGAAFAVIFGALYAARNLAPQVRLAVIAVVYALDIAGTYLVVGATGMRLSGKWSAIGLMCGGLLAYWIRSRSLSKAAQERRDRRIL